MHPEFRTGRATRTADAVLSEAAASRLADYKRAVEHALPGVERVILFGSRARGEARDDSDYDVAVVVRDLSDRRHVRRVLSDLAYDHILSGFFIRPIPLPPDYLAPPGRRPTELAEEILRDGVEVT
jgi:predicted nucleotidyltransferase